MTLRTIAGAVLLFFLVIRTLPTHAQSLVGQLGALLTEQRTPTPTFIPDLAAATATGSWEEGTLAVHANGGVGFGGASREYFWSAAATVAPAARLTIVGESWAGGWQS